MHSESDKSWQVSYKTCIILALLILSLTSLVALAQGGNQVWLPLILKGGDSFMPVTTLRITDGDTKISLIKPATSSGYHLFNWTPAISGYKGGGTWQSSPLADGRRLVDKRFDNTIETFELKLSGFDQDGAIRESQEIRRLLEKASAYWTTDWQDEPVWLEVQASCETNMRYALVFMGMIPQDDNFFGQPWLQPEGAAMDELTLVIERGPWTANEPGTGTCVEISAYQSNWTAGTEGWMQNTAQPVSDVYKILDTGCGFMLASDSGDVWRTATGGAVWTASTIKPAMLVRTLLEASDGFVYAAGRQTVGGGGEVWRSGDCGINWVQRNATIGTLYPHSLIEADDGYLYLACGGIAPAGVSSTLRRSNDGGTTWNTVLDIGSGTVSSVFQASDGYFYAAGLNSAPGAPGFIYRSPDGVTWGSIFYTGPSTLVLFFFEPGDGYLYAGGTAVNLLRSSDGLIWTEIANPPGTGSLYDMILAEDGYFYCLRANSALSRSLDTYHWNAIPEFAPAGGGTYTIEEYSGNGFLYAGALGEIWYNPSSLAETTVGQTETCSDENFVVNKQNIAQLTYMWVFDASGPTYVAEFPAAAFPYDLLPDPMANGDAVYFGITPALIDTGPFNNLVLNLTRTAFGTYDITWEYSDGLAGWPALDVTDGTGQFANPGVNSVHWVPPDAAAPGGLWAAENVNGVNALWVRAIVANVVGNPVGPEQGTRDVYTCNWPYMIVDDAQVLGDIPALLELRMHNRSDNDGPVGEDPEAWNARSIVGLRSVDRGITFVSFINLADEQNPVGVTVAAGTGNTVFADDIEAPSGRRMTHTTDGLSLWHDEAVVTLGPDIARDFYGVFHVFLRAQQVDFDTEIGEVKVRFQVRSGSGGVTYTTEPQLFRNLNPWQLVDFGQVPIPASGVLSYDDLGDESSLVVQVWSSIASLTVYLYDLNLTPVDEWAGDFVDQALNAESGVENGCLLDIDSLIYPKRDIRAMNREFGSDLVRSVYQPIVNGPAILQANADQALYFLIARGAVTGAHTGANNVQTLTDANASFITSGVLTGQVIFNITDGSVGQVGATVTATTITNCGLAGGADNDWDTNDEYLILAPCWVSEPWVAHSIQLWANARYLSARGNR